MSASPIVDRLRAAATDALRARDRVTLAAVRAALAAIDNASAVPLTDEHRAGAVEASGRVADVPRRELSEQDRRAVVSAEVRERLQAAEQVRGHRPDVAAELESTAALLQRLLDG